MKKLRLDQLGRVDVATYRMSSKIPVCILLDNVRSLHNVGSAFRTADAFRVERIYLTGITGRPPHREIHKTALGATESVNWTYAESAGVVVRDLKQKRYTIVVVEQTNESLLLNDFTPRPGTDYCLVFGNEVSGVSESVLDLADVALEIPQAGTKHSLNIAVCLGIVVWEFHTKLSKMM